MGTQYIIVGYNFVDGRKEAGATFIEDGYIACHERVGQMLVEYGYFRVLVQFSENGDFKQKTFRLDLTGKVICIDSTLEGEGKTEEAHVSISDQTFLVNFLIWLRVKQERYPLYLYQLSDKDLAGLAKEWLEYKDDNGLTNA